jgi:hypothetical protein
MRSGLLLLCAIAALLAESTAGVKWTAPAGWVSKGTAPMRAATYTVGDAECVVYFFGQGQGGSVEANLARWNGQFTHNGAPAVAKTAKRTVHGLPVTTMDVTGVYAGMGGPMMAPQAPQSDYRMLAAIVENPNGNLFVKFTGPVKTVTANEQKFEQLVASFQKE